MGFMPTYHLGTGPCNFAKGYKTVLFIDACLFLAFAVRQVFDSAGTISERQEFQVSGKINNGQGKSSHL